MIEIYIFLLERLLKMPMLKKRTRFPQVYFIVNTKLCKLCSSTYFDTALFYAERENEIPAGLFHSSFINFALVLILIVFDHNLLFPYLCSI